ncbi:TetR/AcrR family transcriptional regulator [Dactylosporangium sp. AC04546]|uniref:TetR/AcrR family transcriptional regulator n=1 Tax=Dactylosporangium sp. AC04546 TaxID=2862460 RepID=UPI001EDDDCE0|nr:TetR/AcrR family transcriptional regulator [Dactylosporangium sp. AC04546]WVK84995.1 TetR/AcrR family transcriptional regulator [Dactylosporangium sp. AC04546]
MLVVIVKESRVARDVRGRMVEGAAVLLAKHGLQATSFSEVLKATGAPRGSIYHHFPEGKDQLVGSALDLVSGRMLELLEQQAGKSAEEVTRHVLDMWRYVLERSHFSAGCAVLAVTVAADSKALLDQAAAVFRTWRERLAALYGAAGWPSDRAARFAAMVIASSEGAVVMSRAEQSIEPFELVAADLLEQSRRA